MRFFLPKFKFFFSEKGQERVDPSRRGRGGPKQSGEQHHGTEYAAAGKGRTGGRMRGAFTAHP